MLPVNAPRSGRRAPRLRAKTRPPAKLAGVQTKSSKSSRLATKIASVEFVSISFFPQESVD